MLNLFNTLLEHLVDVRLRFNVLDCLRILFSGRVFHHQFMVLSKLIRVILQMGGQMTFLILNQFLV